MAATAPDCNESEPLALCGRFLAALSDPGAGAALYDLHSQDALLRQGQGIAPASALDAHSFAAAHRDISLAGTDVLPAFEPPQLLQLQAEAASGTLIVWCEVIERRTGRQHIVAFGLCKSQAALRVGWCTLASGVQSWSYRDGRLQSLADYPWMRSAQPARARALLDAAYFRRYHRSDAQLLTLPDARFSCQMSTACCKHDYEISLPPEAQLLIDAMPWDEIEPRLQGTRLANRADGKLQLKDLNERCRFLGPQRQCLIHQTLGQQPFDSCCVFPFTFAHTPQGVAVALSPICGSVRLGLGVKPSERLEDLRERLVHVQPRQADRYRIAPDTAVPWETFRDVEKGLRECLATQSLPLKRRLHVGARLLGALTRGEAVDTTLWLNEPLAAISAEMRAAIRGMLTKILRWDRAALRTLPATLPEELFALEVRESAVLERVLQNVVFSKVYSYPFDLTSAHNFVIVLYLLALVMQAASATPLSDVMWQELGSLGVHGLLSAVLHEGVPDGFRAVFGSSEFGLWALAA